MKKIMFNDKYGLTEAILSGRKTQTRRIITCPKICHGIEVYGFNIWRRPSDGLITEICMYDGDGFSIDGGEILPKYKVGEIVAIAQSYKDAGVNSLPEEDDEFGCYDFPAEQTNGWNNKMFVCADLMPHQIRITNVRVERLQDISYEDCLKEGVELNTRQYEADGQKRYCVRGLGHWRNIGATNYKTPREVYACLIDKISGKGTFESNPYVFVYDFELVK